MCRTLILTSGKHTAITYCNCCQLLYIWHNNLLLNFTPKDFLTFKKTIENTSFEDNCLPFPDKKQRIILRTPNDDISFAFTNPELESFKSYLNEAIFMKEVYTLMGTEPGSH